MTTTPGPDPAKVDEVLDRFREAVAEATDRAAQDLRAAGVPDPFAVLLQRQERSR